MQGRRRTPDGEVIEVIGTEEAADPEWVTDEAERRRDVYRDERGALEASLRRRREEMPLAERLARLIARIGAIQTTRAGRIERGRGGGGDDDQAGPPAAETLDVTRHLRVIETRIRDMELELDQYRGITASGPRANMRTFEKDKLLFSAEFRGMHSRDVAEAAPYLGSERTIRRLRSAEGLDTYGNPRPERPRP